MINSLEITSLAVATVIGAYPFEQHIKQTLLIDIQIHYPYQDSQDDLSRTIDYASLCNKVTTMVSERSFQLIETVAVKIAELIQSEFNVTSLRIRVQKPHAIHNAKNIAYILEHPSRDR